MSPKNRHGFRTSRRGAGSREPRKTVLICCQGTNTEVQYFNALKSRRNWSHVTIVPKAKDPAKVLEHAIASNGHGNQDHDYVFIVADRDNDAKHTLIETANACKKKSIHSRKTNYYFVLNNPSFDIWLVWHLKTHPHATPVKNLQKYLADQGVLIHRNKKGSKGSGSPKDISDDFHFEDFDLARSRANQVELNFVGDDPSTSIPEMVDVIEGRIPPPE